MWNQRAFQVLLSVYNAEEFIKRCFDSLNNSLKDEDWILLIGDDASTDNTILEISEYLPQSTAKKVHVFDYPKAKTVGEAKNRLIKEARNFKDDYPAILMMDGDDEMLPERPRMLDTAVRKDSQYVVGGWQRLKQEGVPDRYGWKVNSTKNASTAAKHLQYGPWATLFHYDFLPSDGKFFPEDEINNCGYEDLLTWNHLNTFRKEKPTPHTNNKPVHLYYVHSESVSNAMDQNKVSYQRNTYWALLEMMKTEKKDIFAAPPTDDEVIRGIAKYVMSKKYKQMEISKQNHSLTMPIHPLDELKLFENQNSY